MKEKLICGSRSQPESDRGGRCGKLWVDREVVLAISGEVKGP